MEMLGSPTSGGRLRSHGPSQSLYQLHEKNYAAAAAADNDDDYDDDDNNDDGDGVMVISDLILIADATGHMMP